MSQFFNNYYKINLKRLSFNEMHKIIKKGDIEKVIQKNPYINKPDKVKYSSIIVIQIIEGDKKNKV
jgi:hypothetical protein